MIDLTPLLSPPLDVWEINFGKSDTMRPCQVAVFSVCDENIHLGDSFVMIGPITT